MIDITLKAGNGLFIYGVRAIILNDDSILMVKNEKHQYYYPVGGRAQFGETSEIAVLREAYEETSLNFEIDRLAFIHENFFVGSFLDNEPCHEISLFFLMKPHKDIQKIKCNSVGADGGKESLIWLPINKLSDYQIFPEFYKTELQCLTNEVRHFITQNENTFRAK
jgi:ADP-ribose pyrophosphatase YjhB (NUDIX family)